MVDNCDVCNQIWQRKWGLVNGSMKIGVHLRTQNAPKVNQCDEVAMINLYLFADTHAARNVDTKHNNGLVDATTTCGSRCWRWFQHVCHVSQLRNLLGQNVDNVLLFTELALPYLNIIGGCFDQL